MKYLVTGGAGFIGSHLVDLLISLNNDVLVLDNLSSGTIKNIASNAEFIKGDISDFDLVDELLNKVDGCFHLAALSSVELCRLDPLYSNKINLASTINIFKIAASKNIPVVYASSAAVYGLSERERRNEEDYVRPINNYGADKYSCEVYAHSFYSLYNLKSVGCRIFNCYGSRQRSDSDYSGVIAKFANSISQGKEIIIYGDGSFTRDFIFIEDVVSFFYKAMLYAKDKDSCNEIVNICTGKEITILNLAKTISKIFNKDLNINYKPARLGDISRSVGDNSKSAVKFNWTNKFSLEEGLKKLF